ncbi:MAG: T9SS type A sorting domain-containing protein [Ignavibacteria bacterium]|nr:T9SS type A sorting domain-containing protein [Ignavibacteria bacterium]
MKVNFLKILPFFILGFLGGVAFSQDNPNLDQLPYRFYDSGPGQPLQLPFVVTGSDYFDNFDIGIDFAEAHLVVNPTNALNSFVIYNNTSTVTGITPHVTFDGVNWTTIHPSWGAIMRGDPIAAFDSLGNLYAENMYGDAGGNILGTKIAKSTNGGQTWASIINGNVGRDKNWIACDQTGGPYANYVYGTMTANSGGNIMRSTDFGATFNVVANYPQTLPGMMVCVGPNKTGGNIPGGCVYVVTNTGSSFAAVYTFYRSTDGGASFTQMSQVQFANYVGINQAGRNGVENMRTRPYPFITADNSYGPFRGRLYLIYSSNFPSGDGNKPDIWLRYSDDQGASWSSAARVNDDVNPEAHHQWHPATWCDKKTGRLFIKWLDTRDCPTSDSCLVYATYSDNGGVTFAANQQISNKKFKINCTSCGGGGNPGEPIYEGDYDAINSNGRNSIMAWTDFRNGNFASYTAYFPDYAMKTNVTNTSVGNNDSAFVTVSVPAVKLYNDRVKFTASLDSLPTSGSLQLSFVNGKDSITTFPDSVKLRIKTVGTVNTRLFKLTIKGSGPGGVPVHTRNVDLLVNSAYLTVGSNRNGLATINVNSTPYTTTQTISYPIGTNITLQAVTPTSGSSTRYAFVNWSNGGANPQTITLNNSQTITANYKAQYKLTGSTAYSSVIGTGQFFDSAATMQFAIASRRVLDNGTMWYFHGWNGIGTGAYSSPDSSGADSAVTWKLIAPVIEQALWTTVPIGIHNISTELPKEYALMQNYPNPFNPTTNIRFDLPRSSFVTLKVYDMLGKEIATLLDRNLQAASYMIDFNASELPSGIYFYKLQAGDYVSIKKMTLVK